MEITKIEDIEKNIEGQFFFWTCGDWKTTMSVEACNIKEHQVTLPERRYRKDTRGWLNRTWTIDTPVKY